MNRRVAICAVLFAIMAAAGCRGVGHNLADIDVQLEVVPDPPRIGPSTVVVVLHDVAGQPVVGAEMSLEGNMGHAGMVPVLVQASEVEPGRYEASLEFTMGGDWFILVQATLPDGRLLKQQMDVLGVDALCGTPAP